MVDRVQAPEAGWIAVDDYIAGHLLGDDAALTAALAANAEASLPAIDASPAQGKMLHLMARSMGARRILEVGTLGGYSTIGLARAVGEGGEVVTLELEPHYAAIARANLDRADVGERVEIVVGPAIESLARLSGTFDFIFIDADKPSNVAYLREALRLSRAGTTIVIDNVVREGGVLDSNSTDDRILGTRALFEAIAANPRLTATAVQTVGAKKWDGFVFAVVDA
jgi:predicted O-methyltransferase YrrM